MSRQSNAEPVIIKRKKVVSGGGHHGGAWKVAYADFVTAMMAFFMMMWLLNATTEKQRRGLADFFSPNIPISRQSGGGEGVLSGDSIYAEEELAYSGSGATNQRPTEAERASGELGQSGQITEAEMEQTFRQIEYALTARSGESAVSDELLEHIVTRVTDEGLVVELFDIEDEPIFVRETDRSTPLLRALTEVIARVSMQVPNNIAIGGHVRSNPLVRVDNPVWPLSAARADRVRSLIVAQGFEPARVRRVTGHADRSHSRANPMDIRNNRVQIIYLRE